MAHLANGRIVLWQGGSLWVMQVLALPQSKKRTDVHAHHAIQITLALDGEFELHLADRAIHGPSVVVAADVPHAFEPKGLIALLFVEPESSAGRALTRALLAQQPVVPLPSAHEPALRAAITRAIGGGDASDDVLRELGQDLIRNLARHAATPAADPRVDASIEWAAARLDRRISMSDVADEIGLSVDRMSHLFVEQTGLPFRTYLLWLRMTKAVEAYAQGQSLTTAAHDAGFADSAHFSRTFRRMFGVAAAELRLA